jgi:hypothetical protein
MQAPSRLFDLLCSIQAVLAPCIIVSLTVIMRRLCIQRGETEGRWQPLRASALRLRYWIAFITFLVSGSPQDGTLRLATWTARVCLVLGYAIGGLAIAAPHAWLFGAA